jgi:hypothetical protein
MVTFGSREDGNEFSNACGTRLNVISKPSEIVKGLVNTFLKAHPSFGL